VVRLTYGEEEPLVRTIEVAVAADGGVTIDTSELRPGCMQQGAAECWNRTVQKRLLASEAHRRLVATVPVAALAELPREDAVAPGAPRVWVTIDGGAAGRVDVRCSRASAERATGFGTLRAAILEMAVSQRSSR
jgi:hypothetical protein